MPVLGWRGNALRFFRNKVAYLTELRRTYGKVACLVDSDHPTLFTRPTAGRTRTIFGFGPECNQQILTQPDVFQSRRPRGPDTEAFRILSNSILFMRGEKHKQQRRFLTPAFTREHLKTYHDDIIGYTEQLAARWRDGQPIDIYSEMNNLFRNVAVKALFGLEPSDEAGSLSHLIRQVIEALFSPVTMIPIDLPGTPFRRLQRNMEAIVASVRGEIERKRSAAVKGDDVLSLMIEAHDEDGGRLSDEELVSQSFVLFFAGHDTGSSALAWTFFLLAQHPEVTAELVDELDSRLGGAPPTYEEIYELSVLDRVIKESLRLLSPAIVFPRVATQTTTLGAYEIPAGSEVLYSSYITHHDPEIYREPQRFLPDRWLDFKPSTYEYLPFGAGARRCIGASFAGMQLRAIIATLLQRYRLQTVPGAKIEINVDVVMTPKNGLPMIVHRQDRQFDKSKAEVRGYIREMVVFD